jgi:enterochelin esterase-like enzyme
MRRRGRFEDLGTLTARGLAKRRVRAYVPVPSGNEPRPVLFMFDGQNVFDDAGSFAGGWRVHEVVEKHAHGRRTPAPIVVAIDHGGTARIDELAPFRDAKHGGGKLPALIDALATTLIPRVDARFGVATRRYIGGASLGGLAAIYAHLLHPSLFSGALAMSPSLWFTRPQLAALLHDQAPPESSRIYLDCGGREGSSMWPAIEAFAHRLQTRGWRDARGAHRLRLHFAPRGKHDEAAWRRRFPRALRFLLAR